MGKLVELLKGISLPPDIEADLRLLDLRFEQMEARIKAIDETETLLLDELNAQQEPRYTTQRMMHADDPTQEEANVLKLMQPPGQRVRASIVAANLTMNLTTAQNCLNEVCRKGFASKHATRGGFNMPAQPATYSLNDKGIKYLVDHGLTD